MFATYSVQQTIFRNIHFIEKRRDQRSRLFEHFPLHLAQSPPQPAPFFLIERSASTSHTTSASTIMISISQYYTRYQIHYVCREPRNAALADDNSYGLDGAAELPLYC